MDFQNLMNTREYDFLRTNVHLGNRIILLGLGGSYAYGTNNENSDIDFRGITLNLSSDLLGLTQFEQYIDEDTDTVIYSFNKIVSLLLDCNPNTIELLGLEREQYLILNELGEELLKQKGIFLSKRAAKSFGGYASAQLRRLQNAIARDSMAQEERERHIYHSVLNAIEDLNRKKDLSKNGNFKLYIDKSDNPELDTEIFLDTDYKHLPLRDYHNMLNTMTKVITDYDKIGKRNKKKDDNHLNKHAMHLIRLFLMAIDILEQGEIITYRRNDFELLRSIRKGDFQKSDGTYKKEFYDMLAEYEKRLQIATEMTKLPDNPDMDKVGKFVEKINRIAIDLK